MEDCFKKQRNSPLLSNNARNLVPTLWDALPRSVSHATVSGRVLLFLRSSFSFLWLLLMGSSKKEEEIHME